MNSPWCIQNGILRTAPDPSGAMRHLPFQGRQGGNQGKRKKGPYAPKLIGILHRQPLPAAAGRMGRGAQPPPDAPARHPWQPCPGLVALRPGPQLARGGLRPDGKPKRLPRVRRHPAAPPPPNRLPPPPRNQMIRTRNPNGSLDSDHFLFGASGDTELFEKASNINGFQGGRVANNLYISPFRATVFKTAALFLYLNSSVVIRVRKPLFFPL